MTVRLDATQKSRRPYWTGENPVTEWLDKGLPCSTDFVLKWESEFISRGIAFGRAGIWSKNGDVARSQSSPSSTSADDMREWCRFPKILEWGFVNAGLATFETPGQVDVGLNTLVPYNKYPSTGTNSLEGIVAANHHPMPLLSLFPEISQLGHGDLLDYYIQYVCPRTTASSTMSSPFASVILPFGLSASPTLFKAIQALSACHRSRANPAYGVLGLRLKSETLKDLRHRLSSEGSLTCSEDPEVLVIMMMLCLYEIVDKCDQYWTIHLKGAKDLIRLRRQRAIALSQPTTAPDPASAFAEHFFAFQDVMGRTACGKEALFGGDYWQADDRKIDMWMGCSPELVLILSNITDLSRARPQFDSDASQASFVQRASILEEKLLHLVQDVGDGAGAVEEMIVFAAETKRLSALLYLHCAVLGSCPTTPLVVDYVRQILELISELIGRGYLASAFLFPIFVAAIELDPSRDEIWSDSDGAVSGRATVLRALDAMTESTISNVARTRAVIVQVWQARDQDLLKRRKECNDWECYVVPVSDAMNLA
ncbi:hypothetical protein N7495_000034 [Penicillium taxi]|uniref:uncharacterized protein n=1 Tax=Penicillium taxi TaxID=168475 RepID=UPI002545742D|nr:uncharacterized protein N7495_000034 [Penicillium taxi]KAJ5907352.1 hypothetical protein N7495_000034 [Penicillium taxi]